MSGWYLVVINYKLNEKTMNENKFKYINFQNNVTYFDHYFEYLKNIESSLPEGISLFFCDHNKYALQTKNTLHNAWIENMQIINKYIDNEKHARVDLTLLLADRESRLKLIYYDVLDIVYQQEPLMWPDRATDLLTHEFSITSKDNYRHILEFDRGVWLTLIFKDFSYENI